jgi:hypothetical protein
MAKVSWSHQSAAAAFSRVAKTQHWPKPTEAQKSLYFVIFVFDHAFHRAPTLRPQLLLFTFADLRWWLSNFAFIIQFWLGFCVYFVLSLVFLMSSRAPNSWAEQCPKEAWRRFLARNVVEPSVILAKSSWGAGGDLILPLNVVEGHCAFGPRQQRDDNTK